MEGAGGGPFELSPWAKAQVHERIKSGECPDVDTVVSEAPQLLQERDDRAEREQLPAAIDLGFDQIEQGEGVEVSTECTTKSAITD